MNNLNSVLIEGIVTEKPILTTPSNSTPVCTFTLVSTRINNTKDHITQETSNFDIEVNGKLAETCAFQLSKGRGVRIVGRLKQEHFEATEEPRTRIIIIAEHVEFKSLLKTSSLSQDKELVDVTT